MPTNIYFRPKIPHHIVSFTLTYIRTPADFMNIWETSGIKIEEMTVQIDAI